MKKNNISLTISRSVKDNSLRRTPSLLSKKLPLVLFVSSQLAIIYSNSAFAVDYFNPNALETNEATKASIDLSQFSNVGGQIPGTYLVDIYLNDNKIDTKNVTFVEVNGKLEPQLTLQMLKGSGVNVGALPLLLKLQPNQYVLPVGNFIPGATTDFNFAQQKLNVSIPQAMMESTARDEIDPAQWDQGIPALILNYNTSGSENFNTNNSKDSDSQYLNLRSGANLGAWRLRNYSSYTHSTESGDSWDSIDTYIQRDIQFLRSQLTMGDTATAGDVFDSIQFKGVQMASDDSMLPDSLRGFAPIIHGIAQSNAQVSVKQNGSVIYQTYVPPGAFTISDLYPTSSSGDLEVTVKEADGSERSFTQPFSAVPIMQREGHLKYALTGGKYRSSINGAQEPDFVQSTLIYGLPGSSTVYGGVLNSGKYSALALGLGHGFGSFGSISADVTQAKTELIDNHGTLNGQSYRFQYAKDIETTGTSFTLAGYRYSTSGYYDFQEANEYLAPGDEYSSYLYNKRSRLQININQSLDKYGSLYLSGYQQDYWQTSGHERNISAGYNLSMNSISYTLSYSEIQSALNMNNSNNRLVAFSVQIPLSKWLPNSWANYSVNNSQNNHTLQQVGISGTALADNNLSYSVQQSYANQGGGDSGNAAMDYRGTYGELSAGYNYAPTSHQINYGVNGAVVAHPYGVTLSQPMGDTAVLVRAPGAAGISVENNTGVTTDWRGYAIVPYASTYHRNRVALDTQSMGENVDIDNNIQFVVPTSGALVLADFKTRIGNRVLLNLVYHAQPVPFGATVALLQANEKIPNTGIVGQSGQVYLSGLAQNGTVQVTWGRGNKSQCRAQFSLPAPSALTVQTLTAVCQ